MVKVAGIWLRNSAAASGFWSTLTATISKPWFSYLACISFIQGKDWRHGPHQEAQKSSNTTLPRKSERLILPSRVGRFTLGAGPVSSAKAGILRRAAQKSVAKSTMGKTPSGYQSQSKGQILR